MKNKFLFTFLAVVLALTCNAQEKLFKKAIEAGRQPNKFYVLRNEKNKMIRLTELREYAEKNNIILGNSTTKEISRFGDVDTSIETLEFLPKSEYEAYICANVAPHLSSFLSGSPQQCTAIIFRGFDNYQPFQLHSDFKWFGSLINGKPNGKGVGFVKDGNEIVYTVGEYEDGFPFGKIETFTCSTIGEYSTLLYEDIDTREANVGKMSDGMASFEKDNVFGFYNSEGIIVIKPRYKEVITPFANGRGEVLDGMMECVIDKSGKFLEYTDHQKQLLAQAEGIRSQAINMAEGRGVPRNTNQAVELFKKAAAMGDAEAQFRLGRCYHNGDEGIAIDYDEAFRWYNEAASKGNAKAIRGLAICYEEGKGVTKNITKAQELYSKAFPDIRRLAEQGDAEGQLYLGHCYNDGNGVTKDYAMAVEWYQKATEQGNAHAQFNLGLCYENGNGVAKDIAKAVELYQKAAEQGNARAQNRLGNCYYIGNGVAKDLVKAVELYRKAAEQGDAVAQCNLGYCYYYGDGVTKDNSKAVVWLQKAANQGSARAQYLIGDCYYYGYGVTSNSSMAVKWYQKAAEQGNVNAQYSLGYCYFYGYGITKDISKAVVWLQKAADQGSVLAQVMLGDCYYKGDGVTSNYSMAVKWYQKAAEQGNSYAQECLGDCYLFGIGVTENAALAVEWFQKAAEQGNTDAIYDLGYCYENGKGFTKNMTKAMELYRKAAGMGHNSAMCRLGDCYRDGNGVPKNTQKAIEWYTKAGATSRIEAIQNERADAAKRAQFNKRLGYNTKNTTIQQLVKTGRNINAVIDYVNSYYVNGKDYFINLYQDYGSYKTYKLFISTSISIFGSRRSGRYRALISTNNGIITSVTW